MASPTPEVDPSSMFMQKGETKRIRSPVKSEPSSRRNSIVKANAPAEVITVKDFFDFMKTAYQVYEHLEGDEDEGSKINWEELTKLTVINHVIEQQERDLLYQTAYAEPKPVSSKSETTLEPKKAEENIVKRYSYSEIEGKGRRKSLPPEARVEMLGVWTEANLNCKLNDVINEGILDSILPYLVGYKKPNKTTSVYTPIIKKISSTSSTDVKKPASFGGFVNEKESRDRLGRRKSSLIAVQEKNNQKQDGDVEIHVCDEVKGLKKDFRCPQKLLVSKMGYFADVTAGQRLEDMDISVHCDIQIFDWLMRWVKRDSILVAEWPLLDPHNVVPILVSASFLQMEPLLHDCLMYCHAHMSDIVKTSTNLACLSDALLTRLAAMYTNAELECVKDRKDKVQSRLYCKLILSLAEPVPETLRGHYSTLATLFKCSKCNKLLGRHIAEQVPCQPAAMRVDRRGNVVSAHCKLETRESFAGVHHSLVYLKTFLDVCRTITLQELNGSFRNFEFREPSWSLNEYITWLYGELRSWRRVYWRLWADCHFMRCQLCDTYFPAYQMEWCSHHEQPPHMLCVEGRALAAGRYPCCGERAYRFETLTRNTGCQFREHVPSESLPSDAAVLELYSKYRDIIAMRPPQLLFPERVTRLVQRETGEESARLQCKEVFWWEGIQLAPPRPPLGLLGKLYTSNNKFNPSARPGSPAPLAGALAASVSALGACAGAAAADSERRKDKEDAPKFKLYKKGAGGGAAGAGGDSADDCGEQSSSSDSERSSASARSDEDSAPRRKAHRPVRPRSQGNKRPRVVGRQWASCVSARSNQDQQRRFEERAARQMRAALARRANVQQGRGKQPAAKRRDSPCSLKHASPSPAPPLQKDPAPNQASEKGGVYARLEAEWRERHGAARARSAAAPRGRAPAPHKYK